MRLILFVLVFAAGGVAVGTYTAKQEYNSVENNFGPFSEVEGFTADQLPDLLGDLAPKGFSKLEVIGDTAFDFGVMHRNEKGSHTFEIKNVGDDRLNLEVTNSTCKCTVGELEKEWIERGEIAKVKLTWKTRAKGRLFSQSATISTNDPHNSEIKLSVTGKLVDSVLLEPASWSVGVVRSGDPIELEMTVYNYNEGKIKLLEPRFLTEIQDFAEISFEERVPSEERDGTNRKALQAFDFTVKIEPGMKQGSLNHKMRCRYKGIDFEPEADFFETSLVGEIVGPLQLVAGSRLEKTQDGGGYSFNVGKVLQGQEKIEKLHLVVRGEEYRDLKLEISEVFPRDVFEVSIGKEEVRSTLKSMPINIRVREDAPLIKKDGKSPSDFGWVLLKPVDSNLSPLKLWLAVEVAKVPSS